MQCGPSGDDDVQLTFYLETDGQREICIGSASFPVRLVRFV